MRVQLALDERPCEVVEAEFVFGPLCCSNPTRFTTVDNFGTTRRICKECVEATRGD